MRKLIFTVALAGALLGIAGIALAQDATPTPVPATVVPAAGAAASEAVTGTVASTVTVTAPTQAYVTLDLQAGFALDPFFVSVNGGGEVDASTMDPKCTGFTSKSPVLTLNWQGAADFARFFFYSDHDPSLIVQLPDGSFVCGKDANRLVQDPVVNLTKPAPGGYSIWVGNENGKGLIPGVLVVTTKDQFNVGSFQLQGFVHRPVLRDRIATALDNLPDAEQIQSTIAALLARKVNAPAITDGVALTASVEVTGLLPGFVWPVADGSPERVCTGLSRPKSMLDFTVPEGTPHVRAFFESNADGGLVVFGPDGAAFCDDDSQNGANRNPVVDLENPAPGTYAVIATRIGSVQPITGTLTVTTDNSREPAMLKPAAPHGATK